MRKSLATFVTVAMLMALPATAFAAAPERFGFEGQQAWAEYEVEIEGVGMAYLGVGGFSGSLSDGMYSDEWSEASFYLFADGIECFGYAEIPQFDLDKRLSGASISAELMGECYLWDHRDEGEEAALHLEHENGEEEPEFVPVTLTLSVNFVGVGPKENSNGFWRSPGFRCSNHETSRDATTTGTVEIDGGELLSAIVDLSSPVFAGLSHYSETCQVAGGSGDE